MMTEAGTNVTQKRRWAFWLFMLAGVALHSCLCPPDVHAGVLAATARTCVVPDAAMTTPADLARPAVSARAARPCAPAPRPHHHVPCLVMSHRGFSHERSTGAWPAGALPPCPLPVPYAGEGARSGACARERVSRPPSRRSGSDLLIGLCSSRT